MLDDFGLELLGARLVVFETVYFAVLVASLLLRCCIHVIDPKLARIPMIHSPCSGVREGPTPCAGFDNNRSRPHAEFLQDVAIVRCVYHLGSMWERDSP